MNGYLHLDCSGSLKLCRFHPLSEMYCYTVIKELTGDLFGGEDLEDMFLEIRLFV